MRSIFSNCNRSYHNIFLILPNLHYPSQFNQHSIYWWVQHSSTAAAWCNFEFWILTLSMKSNNLNNLLYLFLYRFCFQLITEKLGEATCDGTVLLNLLLQFWFRENRYDVNTLTSIADRINSELTELLTNTSLGRIFSSLKVLVVYFNYVMSSLSISLFINFIL